VINCSLNEKDAERGDCGDIQGNIAANEQANKETNNQNNNTNEKREELVEIGVQDEKDEKDTEVVGDNTSHNEQLNQKQSLDDQSAVDNNDHVIDCNDQDNADDGGVCYQGDGNDGDCHGNSDDDDDDSDDDDGWITPENIKQVKADYGMAETQCKPTDIAVGCLTTDFAMQVRNNINNVA
jgi:RNA-binding protein NOB1